MTAINVIYEDIGLSLGLGDLPIGTSTFDVVLLGQLEKNGFQEGNNCTMNITVVGNTP